MEKGVKSLEMSTDYQSQGSNLSSRMTMSSGIVVDSLEAGLCLVCTIAISLSTCVNGRPKTFPQVTLRLRRRTHHTALHSTLVYTLGTQCPGLLPPDTSLRPPLRHTAGLWAGVRSPLLTAARPCPDSVGLCVWNEGTDRQTPLVFFFPLGEGRV